MNQLAALLLALLALSHAQLAAAQAAQTDRAGHRLEALIADGEGWRTQDGVWRIIPEGREEGYSHGPTHVRITLEREGVSYSRLAIPLDDDSVMQRSQDVWPFIVRLAASERDDSLSPSSVLIGIQTHFSTMYSGGGAQASELTLHLVEAGPVSERAENVLTVPMHGSVMIRACFSEEDMETRAGACHDEYTFDAALSLDAGNRAPMPRFSFATEATSFPGRRGRYADSTRDAPLRERDLHPSRDPECSYTRRILWNAAVARYEFNRPAPSCSDYLDR